MRRLVLSSALGLAIAACGIAYSPGEFLVNDETPTGTSGSVPPSVDAASPEASAPDAASSSSTRIMLFGSTRPAVPGATVLTPFPLTMLTTLAAGDAGLSEWTFDEPPPVGGIWTRAVIENGTIYLQGASYFSEATFTDHITSPWTMATLSSPASDQGHGWLVDAHAFHETSALTATQFIAPIYDDAGVGPWAATTTAESVLRADETLVRVGHFVYALGGFGNKLGPQLGKTGSSDVEIAPYDEASGNLGAFTSLDSLYAGDAGSVGDAGAVFGVYLPVVATGGGRIVIAGGVADRVNPTLSATVLATRSDPTTGALDPWVTLPPLPQAMKDFALVVTPDMIIVFGGTDATPTIRMESWSLAIGADGTYGTAWTQLRPLPGGRSGLTAVTY